MWQEWHSDQPNTGSNTYAMVVLMALEWNETDQSEYIKSFLISLRFCPSNSKSYTPWWTICILNFLTSLMNRCDLTKLILSESITFNDNRNFLLQFCCPFLQQKIIFLFQENSLHASTRVIPLKFPPDVRFVSIHMTLLVNLMVLDKAWSWWLLLQKSTGGNVSQWFE